GVRDDLQELALNLGDGRTPAGDLDVAQREVSAAIGELTGECRGEGDVAVRGVDVVFDHVLRRQEDPDQLLGETTDGPHGSPAEIGQLDLGVGVHAEGERVAEVQVELADG